MGYGIMPFAVDLPKMIAVVGCRDQQLIDDLLDEFEDHFEEFDEMAADASDDEEGAQPLTMRTALTQMVMGLPYNEDLGFMYGYALELLCRFFGEMLSNRHWVPISSDWPEQADEALKKAGIDANVFSMLRLMYRGEPVPVPRIDDFPGIGYLTRDEIATALGPFGAEVPAGVADDQLAESLDEARGWLVTCAESGRDLVCFYH